MKSFQWLMLKRSNTIIFIVLRGYWIADGLSCELLNRDILNKMIRSIFNIIE